MHVASHIARDRDARNTRLIAGSDLYAHERPWFHLKHIAASGVGAHGTNAAARSRCLRPAPYLDIRVQLDASGAAEPHNAREGCGLIRGSGSRTDG